MAEPGSVIDVKEFLNKNKLSDAFDIFSKRDITIEELMEFDEADLKQFGKDIGLDVLQINRLIKSIKQLCPEKQEEKKQVPGTASMYNRSSPIIQVIVSEEEQRIISKFNNLYNIVLLMANNIRASFNILEENGKRAKQDLHNLYAKIISNLEEKRKELLTNLKEVDGGKQRELYQQINELKQHEKNINIAKMEYESLVSNPTLELKYRKKKIKKLMQNIQDKENENKYICSPYHLITEPNISIDKSQFEYLQDVLFKNISISSCDFPSKPILSLKKQSHNSITIKWKTKKLKDNASYNKIPILRYEIQYKAFKDNNNKDKLQWKSVFVVAKKSSFKIVDLTANSKYIFKMRGENKNGFGKFCDELMLKTNEMKLVWDQKLHGNTVEFIKKNRVKCGANSSRNIVISTFKIDKSISNKFNWEIKCDTISNYSWIGFVRYPASSYITNWNYFLGGMTGVYSIGIGQNVISGSINANCHSQSNGKSFTLPQYTKNGDIFKFEVNWKKKNVNVYHNGKLIQLNGRPMFENINETCIVPAVSSNTSPGEYTIQYPKH